MSNNVWHYGCFSWFYFGWCYISYASTYDSWIDISLDVYKRQVLMPAGDMIQEKQVLYTFDTKQSLANLIKKLDAHQLGSYKELWLFKQKHSGVTSSVVDFKEYHIDGNRYDTQSEARDRRMATASVDFGFAGYLLANRLYERMYGVQFDDVVGK